jgi:hypothetical protein
VSDFELPAGSEALFDRHHIIMGFESVRALAWEYTNFPEQISQSLKPRLDEGWQVTRADYDAMRETARRAKPRARTRAPATRSSIAPGRYWVFPASPCRTARARTACRSVSSSWAP